MNEKELSEYINKVVEEKLAERTSSMRKEIEILTQKVAALQKNAVKDKVSILVASYELDNLLPAFIIANGAASFGMEVDLFFTLWGILALKEKSVYSGKTIPEMMMTFMLPDKPENSPLSRLNMAGAGPLMMAGMMKSENVSTLPELMDLAAELGVRMTACQMTMGIMGVKKEELRKDILFGGVATYIETASESKITLFI
jgi:peroxiredoxin family protein